MLCLAWSPCGGRVASCAYDGTVAVLGAAMGRDRRDGAAGCHGDWRASSGRGIGGQDHPNLHDWFAMVCMVWTMQTNGKPN